MNLHTIGIIISREYQNKVRKKSFLVTTFVVPVLMAALCIVPIVMMLNTKEKTKTIAVVDASGLVLPFLENTETTKYVDCSSISVDSVKSVMSQAGYDAVLNLSPIDPQTRNLSAEISSFNPLGMDMVQNINNRIESAVEAYRIDSYQIEGLEEILKEVKADVNLKTYTMDEEGVETLSETGVFAVLSMVMGLILFLFITLFGGMVMTAVIEEKASRVVEVLVSSVKATELMFGKIIGIALVALTQFFLWIVLTGILVGIAGKIAGPQLMGSLGSDPAALVQSMGAGDEAEEALASLTSQIPGDSELALVFDTLKSISLGRFLLVFVLFFIFGYMLYASLYAAIGSAAESEGDTQQLQMPVTIPLMLAYFIAIYTFNAPDSSIAFWGSMIPFTSPVVMIARLPFGVPTWELALSFGLLVLTFALMAYLSAKIYKVGILMFGKKSTWKDLWKWLKQN